MKRNQIPDIVNSDPYYRGSSRYPAQAVPNPAVRYAANQSKAMTLANTRNAVGPLQVNDRPRNESLEEYRTGRAPEAIHQDSMYYQVCAARYKCPFLLPTRNQQGTHRTPAGNAGQRTRVVQATGAWTMPEVGPSKPTVLL